ncbi:Homoprotocatechuate catabolism bifunctional isomerase/decarboxylase [Ephemeroptericola cinctiostellae]|uniref:Homoprotocatechuate catabolism bifunctional isomerase/decarboxylase n=1 Tax=Ephemeroptericola cinctiostellae TaxID=2268024 RepID=A0A345DCA4_9BURK|nr:fumarylacetoacetate hydrolase family protein [Ephemeroptericola cinctiostellae]AXF85992.1 Homoprotocatechuate catabolism bifunctional isomerase/decarboxylase [Ephemeroptericola cinctiostellae]
MRLIIHDVWLTSPEMVAPADVSLTQAERLSGTCVPYIGTVHGVLHNDASGIHELGAAVNEAPYKAVPKAPVLYTKPRNTLRGNGQALIAPEGVAALQVGAALGIVMGDVATRLSLDNALSKVAGYTVVNDASVPHSSFYRPSMRFKTFDASCAIGPWVRGVAQITNPDDLMIHTFINDVLVQEYSTAVFTRHVAQLLVDVTEFMTLQQGDILLLGVVHPPVLAQIGQTVRIEIEQVGSLTNKIEGAS